MSGYIIFFFSNLDHDIGPGGYRQKLEVRCNKQSRPIGAISRLTTLAIWQQFATLLDVPILESLK